MAYDPNDPGISTGNAYRLGFKAAFTGGLAYGGYRFFGPGLAGFARATGAAALRQAKLADKLIGGHLQAGRPGRAIRTALGFAAAPFKRALLPGAPGIAGDVDDLFRLVREGSLPHRDLLAPFAEARLTPPPGGAFSRFRVRDLLALDPGDAALEARPFWKGSLPAGLRQMRSQLAYVQDKVGAGAFAPLLDVPLDPGLLKGPGGGLLDTRALRPRYWGLELWEKFALPRSWSFRIPDAVPILGGEAVALGGARPLAWLNQLTNPAAEQLRRQPIFRVLKGLRDERGREVPYLYANGTVQRLHVERRRGRRALARARQRDPNAPEWVPAGISSEGGVPAAAEVRAWRKQAGWRKRAKVRLRLGEVELEDARVAAASSPLGKGIRIRKGEYQHSLDAYLTSQGVPQGSRTEAFLQFLDRWGIGPHLTSPTIVEDAAGKRQSFAKQGALERLLRDTVRFAFGKSPQHRPSAFVAGETATGRFIPYVAEGGIAKVFGKGAAGKTIQGLSDAANYSLLRPLYLMEEMVGLGLRGGRNPAESLWRIFSRIIVPGYAGAQALRFGDFLAGQATGGTTPSDAALGAYAGFQVGRAKVLEATGVQDLARWLEETAPGSITSPASTVLRTIVGGLGGARLGGHLAAALQRRYALFANGIVRNATVLIAAGLGSLLAGSDPLRSAESLQRRYAGEELVPVRRGRFWELGKSSFFGGDVMYHRPHWIAERRARTFEKALYGSEWNYWLHGNGLSPVKYLDPYWLERRHAKDRPYPETGPLFGDVPILSPILESTVGRLLKPARRHPDLEPALAAQGERWGGEKKLARDASARLGLGDGSLQADEGVVSRFGFGQTIGKQADVLFDWLGMQGFGWGAIAEKLTGNRRLFGGERQLETSDRMAGLERRFYEQELGGGFQTFPVPGSGLLATEFSRRLVPHRERSIELVNPLPNQMPDWLPGPRSAFARDRGHHLPGGFHTGDPYTKIPKGEVRLPGPGYESVRPLHSGIPGVYDPVDRMIILEDVAPGSAAAKHYRTIVDGWIAAGVVDDFWKRQVLEARGRKDEKLRSRMPGTENRFDAPRALPVDLTVSRVTSPSSFEVAELPYGFDLAGVERNHRRIYERELAAGNARTVSEAEAKVAGAETALRTKLEGLVGRKVRLFVAADEAARYRGGRAEAFLPGISDELGVLRDPEAGGLAAYAHGGAVRRQAANIYAGAVSALNELPGPLRWPFNKLLPMKDPVEDYFQFQVEGAKFGAWETPVESFLKPWGRSLLGLGMDHVPEALDERREASRQFQRLRYVKAEQNRARAEAAGDPNLARQFGEEKRRTYLGIDLENPVGARMYARQALEAPEREYLDAFLRLRSTAERKRALKLLPDEAGYIFTNLWRAELPEGVDFQDEDLSQAARRYTPGRYAEADLGNFLRSTDLPGKDWAGWDPRVGSDAVKVKWVENRGDDVHNYGLWESDRRRVMRQFPDLEVPTLERGPVSATRVLDNLARLGLEPVEIRGGSTFDYAHTSMAEIEIRRGRRREKGYDAARIRFEGNKVYFPEPV